MDIPLPDQIGVCCCHDGTPVALIDENPIGTSMMGLDVPQFFGRRIMSTLGNKALMLGRVAAANDALTEAEEAGVDIQLGTCVWGAYAWADTRRLAGRAQAWPPPYP